MTLAPKSKTVDTLVGGIDITDAVVYGDAMRTDGHEFHTFSFKNTSDAVVTVTFQGFDHSPTANAADTSGYTLPGTLTLVADTGSDYETLTQAWTYVRAVYTPTGTASDGAVTLKHIAR